MAQQNFSAAVDRWVLETQRRLLAVFQTATQFVIEDMLERTHVDTGFMRASVVVSTNGPVPMSRPLPPGSTKNQYEAPQQFTLAIAGAELGQVIYATYTANYAGYREYEDGMVRLAAQNWGQHVRKATAMAKARAGIT